jgi:hypothetical protein
MKQLLALLLIVFALGCNTSTGSNAKKEKEKEATGENVNSKLNAFVKAFLDSNKAMKNNAITQRDGEDLFRKQVLSKIKEGLLSDMPLTLLSVDDYTGKNVASWTADVVAADSSYDVTLFITSDVSDSMTKELVKYKKYLVEGQYSGTPTGRNDWQYGFLDVMERFHPGLRVHLHGLKLKLENAKMISDSTAQL